MKKTSFFNSNLQNKSQWFGSDFTFSKSFKYPNLPTGQSSRNLITLHQSQLEKQKEKVLSQISLCHVFSEKFEIVNSQVQSFNSFLKEKQQISFIMNRAATQIQRHVRGYLTRKNIEEYIISSKLNKLNTELDTIKKDQRFFLYYVGRLPEFSALVIQRAYRRHKFREKIDRLWEGYHYYLINKEEENYMRVKHRVRELVCRRILKNLGFDFFKARRLREIREKYAISVIKKNMKKLKIRVKYLIVRMKKYRRTQRAILKRKKIKLQEMIRDYKGDAKDIEKDPRFRLENISIDTVSDLGTTTSDKEAMEREKMLKMLERERERRVSLGKISYNCKDVTLKRMTTLLDQREIPFSNITPQLEVRRKASVPQPKTNFKVNFEGASYLKNTLSFENGQKKIKEKKKKVQKFRTVKLDSLLKPTKSFKIKIELRRLSVGNEDGRQSVMIMREERRNNRASVKLSPINNF